MKHDEIITDAATPSPERIVTHWRRFQSRLWRMAEGDIYKAYSASSFPKAAAFTHEGHLYTNGGHAFSKWFHSEVNCYPLVRADEYCGATNVPFSYEGDEVTYRGKVFRLSAKVIFVASDPKVEEWRHLIRVLFSDGGMFAANCTYAEFLGDRFDPQSGNGRAARLKELAECGARPMPRTQEEMRRLLDGETVSEKLQQIDFAL